MKKAIFITVILLSLAFFLTGCTTPTIEEGKFQNDYVNYNENPVINFRIYNAGDTSFEGKIEIQAIESTGFFNCFSSSTKNISVILPKNNFNGDIQIISLNNTKCKGHDFDVYLTLKDTSSNTVLVQNKLPLRIKND